MIIDEIEEHIKTANEAKKVAGKAEIAAKEIKRAILAGKKVLVCGNGGSAADSQHFAAELVGRFMKERKAMPAIALTTDTSIITALGNDYGFEKIFERQVEALGNAGDILLVISTSGNSENLIRACRLAKTRNMEIITLLGKGGGKMRGLGNIEIIIASENTARIQEMHELILHAICKEIE